MSFNEITDVMMFVNNMFHLERIYLKILFFYKKYCATKLI